MPKVPTVQKIKLSDLRQGADNPRKISASALDLLKDSIRRDPEFMRLRPIVIDGAGMILGGNQRHKALLALGMTEIPAEWVVRADNLTNEQRRRFVIVDNGPEGMSGEWDFEALSLKWDDFPLDEWGLGDIQINDCIDGDSGLCEQQSEPDQKSRDVVDDKVYLRPLACFMGAYFIKSHTQIDTGHLAEWKKDPQSLPFFTEEMVSDFVDMWSKRKTHVDFLTVPPPSGKRKNGYDGYPIEIVARAFSSEIGVPYIRAFCSRTAKTRRGSRARMHQDQEGLLFCEDIPGAVGLVIDDVSTTRTTFTLVHRAFMGIKKTAFCVAWCSFR